ncbi:DUF2303 family protein [Methylobacterium sp. Leaf118]|uniref:DUF2303 family protein n=1 Tax=Methylobacterium sp. Leaf118 TaxID=2876562 RepID=UPI001E593EBD|nr:DUF2303 family protein [Methylobacterium sp. Leaf118]
MLDESAIQKIADLDADGVGKVVGTQDGRERVFSPPGWNERVVEPIDKPLSSHIRQVVALEDAASFAAYVNAFKTLRSRLFVSVSHHSMTAHLDYHAAANGDEAGKPDYLDHKASYTMPFSEEWTRWSRVDGVAMPQAKFAEFLEENLQDIVEPAGASVLEVALQLQSKKKVQFDSGVRLQDGSTQLTYREEVEAGTKGNVKIPTEFVIGIPVFFGGDRYKIKAFLRYRIDEGKLAFHIVLHRKQFVLQDAVQTTAKAVGEETGLSPLFGSVG